VLRTLEGENKDFFGVAQRRLPLRNPKPPRKQETVKAVNIYARARAMQSPTLSHKYLILEGGDL
jgi:hypothetical protein